MCCQFFCLHYKSGHAGASHGKAINSCKWRVDVETRDVNDVIFVVYDAVDVIFTSILILLVVLFCSC